MLTDIMAIVRETGKLIRNADISKARRLLGYDPDYSFQDGIKLAIQWYKENL